MLPSLQRATDGKCRVAVGVAEATPKGMIIILVSRYVFLRGVTGQVIGSLGLIGFWIFCQVRQVILDFCEFLFQQLFLVHVCVVSFECQ